MVSIRVVTLCCGFLFAILGRAFPQHSPLWISEFMASNVLAYENSEGDYADWIEIHNSSDAPIDLAGTILTDDPGVIAGRLIPSGQPSSTTVPAQGYLVLYADGSTNLGANHLGFKLSSDPGVIIFFDADGTTILDSVSYRPQYRDVSCGRFPAAAGQWMYMPEFTPGEPNEQGFGTVAEPPSIDQEAGFYTSISVSVQPAAPGDTIRYTLDGSDPSENSPQYLSPVQSSSRRFLSEIVPFGLDAKPDTIESFFSFTAYDARSRPDHRSEESVRPGDGNLRE